MVKSLNLQLRKKEKMKSRIHEKTRKCILAGCTVLILCMGLTGCGTDSEKEETTTGRPEDTVAIHAGNNDVFLDEAKYYAYVAQGTYEIYYLTKGRELSWSKKTKKGITMEELVKSTVLDDICRRECMYSYRDAYNVNLTKKEQAKIQTELDNYYKETGDALLSKIGIRKERLKKVFEKKEIAKKIENVMAFSDKKLPDETYKKWKEENTVTAEGQWESITFNKPIFTMEDLHSQVQ